MESDDIPKQPFPPRGLSHKFEPGEWHKFLDELRDLESRCGKNKHDRAAILIAACIENGINTMGYIRSVLGPFGYNVRHVSLILKDRTGTDPERHMWSVNASGHYRTIQ